VFFNSVTPFSKHRIGQHGVDRRCATNEEMLAMGMSVNADGYWIASLNTKWRESNDHEDDTEQEDNDSGDQQIDQDHTQV
jgi:hypothetical protein